VADEVEIKVSGTDDSAQALKAAKENIDAVGEAASKAEPKITGIDTRLKGFTTTTDRARPGMEKYGQGLDSVGNRFDEMDTRAMGTADGITGVSELMRHGELSASEMAMAFSDVGSSMYNTVIPSLKGAKEGFGSFIQGATGAKTTMGGLGRAAVGAAGVAGVGLLVNALIDAEEKRKALRVEELTEEFTALGKVDFTGLDVLQGGVEKTFEKLLEQSPKLAQNYIDWMESVSDGAAKTGEFQERVDMAIDAQEGFAEATEAAKTNLERESEEVDALREAMDRLIGKSFDVADAQSNITLGIADMTETVKENRKEIGDAATSLDVNTEAGARNHQMITDLVRDQVDYIEALKESGISNEDLAGKIDASVGHLEDQLRKLGFTEGEVRVYTAALRAVPSTIRTNIGTRGVAQSIHDVSRIRRELEALNGYEAHVRIVGTSVGVVLPGGARFNAHGGIIGAATGGIHGSLRIVGEQGPELVSLPTGSMVHSNPDTRRMLAGAVQGGEEKTVRIVIEGTGVLDGLREEIRVTAGGDVQRGLGTL
jgi:hypothetical protein